MTLDFCGSWQTYFHLYFPAKQRALQWDFQNPPIVIDSPNSQIKAQIRPLSQLTLNLKNCRYYLNEVHPQYQGLLIEYSQIPKSIDLADFPNRQAVFQRQ